MRFKSEQTQGQPKPCAPFWFLPILALSGKSNESPAIASQKTNPYLLLRHRRFPEPLLLGLVFLFGVWLWNNHLGRLGAVPDPETMADEWQLALRKTDRDLRIAESAADFPDWMRVALRIPSLKTTLERRSIALESLLAEGQSLEKSPRLGLYELEGAYSLGVMRAVLAGRPAAEGPFDYYGLNNSPPPEAAGARIVRGEERWWDLAYLRSMEPGSDRGELVFEELRMAKSRSQRLLDYTVRARGAVVGLMLLGLFFVPKTILGFLRPTRLKGYPGNWKISFGLGVFFLAYLSSIGFGLAADLAQQAAIAKNPDHTGPVLDMPSLIVLDGVTRFIPPLIALALLFRRPRHILRAYKLGGPLQPGTVLGGFAIIQVIAFGISVTLDRHLPPSPTGGLSMSEIGGWGLLLGIVSACFAAPIAEEFLFRGVLFRTLTNRMRLWVAVILSSALFALSHFIDVPGILVIASVGAVCAFCYSASGSLLTAIAVHALYNISVKIPEWITYQTPLS